MVLESGAGVSPALNLAADEPSPTDGRWLTVLWPLAILLHLAGNGGHLLAYSGIGFLQVGLVVLAGWMLVQPRPVTAAALGALYVVVLWLKMPVIGNHELILGMFSLLIVLAALAGGTRWPLLVARPGRALLLVAYGFIAVSKLNSGFFDVVSSCAVLFADEFGHIVGVAPSGSASLSTLIIVATAATELAIPVLLVIRRLRRYGVGLALVFHLVLALDPVSHIWDFSSTLLPLFLLFLPVGFHRSLDRSLAAVDARPANERAMVVALILGLQAVAMAGGLPFGLPTWTVAFPVWLALAFFVLVRYRQALADRSNRQGDLVAGHGPRWFSMVAMLIIGVAVLNGLSPYLELRSAAAFNMYSNLRVVDGDSNHVAIGSLRTDTRGYVEVLEVAEGSALEHYVDEQLLVPAENLDRFLVDHPGEDPLIDRGQGARLARDTGLGASTPDGVFERIGDTFLRKLAARRAVHKPGDDRCLRAWGPIG